MDGTNPTIATTDEESNLITERTALLGQPHSNSDDNEADNWKHTAAGSRKWNLAVIFTVYFLGNIGLQILSPAQVQVYEQIFCSQYYREHGDSSTLVLNSMPESMCKIGPIQQEVATLKGWLEFFLAAPGLVLSVPMGMLADRFGRRRLVFLTLLTYFLSEGWNAVVSSSGGRIPLRFVWFGGLINLFGGGGMVADMIIMCMLSDISPSDQLTAVFLRLAAFEALARIIGPTIAAFLMQGNPWWAIITGLACILLSVVLILAAPETLPGPVRKDAEPEPELEGESARSAWCWGLPKIQWDGVHASLKELARIWSDWRTILVGLIYPFRSICFALDDLMPRYVSDRYGWTLADATYTYSIQAIGSGVVLFIILPTVSNALDRKPGWDAIHKNALLSRASLLILAIAFLVIGLSPTAPLVIVGLLAETFSVGLPSALRALVAGLVSDEDHGRVFSVLAAVETVNLMLAFPISAEFFKVGLNHGGGAWLGLPYDILAAVAFLAFLALCFTRFSKQVEPGRGH